MDGYNFEFPAIRGIQAGSEYYVSMCPLDMISKIFLYDDVAIEPELRAQRTLNRSRIPEIAKYLIENPSSYTFSAITVSVDSDVVFEPSDKHGISRDLGKIKIPMCTRILINDGQHRRAALVEALKNNPNLREETIPVVFFVDTGLKRSQQMFADLNKHAVRPTKSLGILYDHRDPLSDLARKLIVTVPIFKGLTEMEKSTISNRSVKLFTLSSIYQSTQTLLKKKKNDIISEDEERIAKDFWIEVSNQFPDWQHAKDGKVTPSYLRKHYIHSHGLALQVLGISGAELIESQRKGWKRKLKKISSIDWSRKNAKLWEGRALVGGRVSKARTSVVLTSNVLKKTLGLKLTNEEKEVETHFQNGTTK